MRRIALVGDIGSGKTFFSKLFGYPVFNADLVVSSLYKKDKFLFSKIKKKFPDKVSTFPLKKEDLLKVIFHKHTNLSTLGKIIHPTVRKKMKDFLKINKKKKFVILDVPLFLENRLNTKRDIIIFVEANKKKMWSFDQMDADHVKAWSIGGKSISKNCQMLCKTHNRAKGNR